MGPPPADLGDGDGIGQGLSGLPRTLVPYGGPNQWIREVMLLGGGCCCSSQR